MNNLATLPEQVIDCLQLVIPENYICFQVGDYTKAYGLDTIDLEPYWLEFIKETTGKEVRGGISFIYNYALATNDDPQGDSAIHNKVIELRKQWIEWLLSNYS